MELEKASKMLLVYNVFTVFLSQREFDDQDESLGKANDEQQQQPEPLELPEDLSLEDGKERDDGDDLDNAGVF